MATADWIIQARRLKAAQKKAAQVVQVLDSLPPLVRRRYERAIRCSRRNNTVHTCRGHGRQVR